MVAPAATADRVHLIALGGTIAMTPAPGGIVEPSLDGAAISRSAQTISTDVEVVASTLAQVPGAHLGLAEIVRLYGRIRELLAAGGRGVVITQGTDTIEETAFALDLLHAGDEPIVVTGAMRHPAALGADGPASVEAAVRIAQCHQARGLGALVAMNDEIHAARFVRKAHASRPSAFTSPTAGPIGWITEDRVRLPLRLGRRVRVNLAGSAQPAQVAFVSATLGDAAPYLSNLADLGYAGLVVAGFGAGHLSTAMANAVADVAAHLPVVLASRTGAGECYRLTYGFPGSETDLLARGLLSACAIDAPKARILLSLAIAAGWPAAQIQEAFDVLSGELT